MCNDGYQVCVMWVTNTGGEEPGNVERRSGRKGVGVYFQYMHFNGSSEIKIVTYFLFFKFILFHLYLTR